MNREYIIEESHEITKIIREELRGEIKNLVEVTVYPIPCATETDSIFSLELI